MFGYTTYQFQCVVPFLVRCLIGAVGCWFSGNL